MRAARWLGRQTRWRWQRQGLWSWRGRWATGKMPDGTLVCVGVADTLRYDGGHRYRDEDKGCEEQNSCTAADADVPQETGCWFWRRRSVLLWQESDVVKIDLGLGSSVPPQRAMRRLPAGGLGVRHRRPRSMLGRFGHHGRLERS